MNLELSNKQLRRLLQRDILGVMPGDPIQQLPHQKAALLLTILQGNTAQKFIANGIEAGLSHHAAAAVVHQVLFQQQRYLLPGREHGAASLFSLDLCGKGRHILL